MEDLQLLGVRAEHALGGVEHRTPVSDAICRPVDDHLSPDELSGCLEAAALVRELTHQLTLFDELGVVECVDERPALDAHHVDVDAGLGVGRGLVLGGSASREREQADSGDDNGCDSHALILCRERERERGQRPNSRDLRRPLRIGVYLRG